MHCPFCTADVPDDDLFCESCGHSLKAASAPASSISAGCICGAAAGEVDADGFCMVCGKRVVRPASDHVEEVLSPLCAAVSDRGLRHDRNEDRFGIVQVGGSYALAVCDGVSTTRTSEVASQAVAAGVLEFLANALREDAVGDPVAVMRAAIAAGAAALRTLQPQGSVENLPSTTVVAALVTGGEATIGWAGDSRAYWCHPPAIAAWTKDHSWVNEIVAAGRLSVPEAEQAPQAHAITRWIGADSDCEPEIVRYPLQAPGMLLLCTDGVWNYAPTPEAMVKLVTEAGGLGRVAQGPDALAVARYLVEFANRSGGHDNSTVALLRVEPVAAGGSVAPAGGK